MESPFNSPAPAKMESDDLSQLMPNIQQRAQVASPANTAALREYIQVRRGGGLPKARRPWARWATTTCQPAAAGADGHPAALQVLGEKQGNVPAASTMPHKPRTEGARTGGARRPQRRYFTIKWRCVLCAVMHRQSREKQSSAKLAVRCCMQQHGGMAVPAGGRDRRVCPGCHPPTALLTALLLLVLLLQGGRA